MTNHHEHNNHLCETHLGLCKRCDVVFCNECGKEWGANSTYTPYPTTTIAGSGDSYVPTACSHGVSCTS